MIPSSTQLPGLDPAWSRTVSVPDADGVPHRWHLLDTGPPPSDTAYAGVMLCVHGNPTWSYLWRRLLEAAPRGWRVIAVDQLGMGWSERTHAPRTLAQRVDDLGRLTAALEVSGPVVVVAHDWGGPIALGWAEAHADQVTRIVLTNTAVHQPASAAPPALIRLARSPALRDLVCVQTPTFVRGTTALSRPALPAAIRRAYASPYARPARRRAVADFVADIPLETGHPSRSTLDRIADGLVMFAETPVLLVWGARDPVFTPRYLEDLLDRLPHADVQWFPEASHLVVEEVPETADLVWRWVERKSTTAEAATETAPVHGRLWDALTARAADPETAVAELHRDQIVRVSFAELDGRVRDLAAGLHLDGVRAGDRVAVLIPPGVDLMVAVYACWRVGATIVVADAGLGLRRMAAALRSAGPDHVIGIARALVAAKLLRVPGRQITDLAELAFRGHGRPLPEIPDADGEAAVLFTSGATGPPKGVVYRHRQLLAQLAAVRAVMEVGPDDRLVAAFAPFALYGPALGVAAAVPDMEVTAPGTLTAAALADAVAAVEATVVFASPAALRNVLATSPALTDKQRSALGSVRRLMSAGAPVPVGLLRAVQALLPEAELHTPYGMTEALPVADISLAQIEAAGSGNGVCVGRPLAGVTVRFSPLDAAGRADGPLTDAADVTGEVLVAAGHVKDRYDRLWATEQLSSRDPGWHRTGDVGHVDGDGRLWIEGRLVHVITAVDGPVTPVGIEQRVEDLDAVRLAAAVGVGPVGTQQLVLVVVPTATPRSDGLADSSLAAAVRAAAKTPVAAVLVVRALPTDIRHQSKIDRTQVARWADRLLAGERARL